MKITTAYGSKPLSRGSYHDKFNLLLVGNNPIELSALTNKVKYMAEKNVITEIAFDIKSLFERLVNFKPNSIVIDDNIGKHSVIEAIRALAQNRKTRDIPVTLLKNSNYQESLVSSSSVLDYMLKQNFSSESLWRGLQNAIKIKRTQVPFYGLKPTSRNTKQSFYKF